MTLKQPTLLEQERMDEERLLKDIDEVNQTLKGNNKKKLFDAVSKLMVNDNNLVGMIRENKRSHSFDTMETFRIGISSSTNGLSDASTALGSKESYTENILTQNLVLEEVLKLIVIGDKGVGKTTFIEKVCGIHGSSSYNPTIS
jgi:flagellar biosynthesis GTPase FlhF